MSGKVKTKVNLPSLPKLITVPRNPPGWGVTEITIRSRGMPGAAILQQREPAGDPPDGWTGTAPEWAVYWALTRLGYIEGQDYEFVENVGGVEASYYSQLDFLFPALGIGLEVQGSFWHMGVGSAKQFSDQTRRDLFAQQGIDVIWLDEDDVLADPIYFVKEALAGVDHSELGRDY